MSRIRLFTGSNLFRSLTVVALGAAIAVAVCIGSGESFRQSDAESPQQEIISLAHEIDNGRVRSVEILNVPADIMTNHALSSEELQAQYSYKLTIPRVNGSRVGKSLVEALKKTTSAESKRKSDLRWGVLFQLDNGQVQAVYLDAFGKYGQIDKRTVSFGGGLFDWLQSFQVCMK